MSAFVCLSFIILVAVVIYFIPFYFITFFLYRQSVYCSSSYYLENPDLSILGRHCLRLILSTAGVQVVHGSRTGSRLAKSNKRQLAPWSPVAKLSPGITPLPRNNNIRFFVFFFFYGGGGGGSLGALFYGGPIFPPLFNA